MEEPGAGSLGPRGRRLVVHRSVMEEPGAAVAKRMRSGPPDVQQLDEQLSSVRRKILEGTSASKIPVPQTLDRIAGEQGEFSRWINRFIDELLQPSLQPLLQEWMRLASRKMSLELSSGTSESERSAEALPWLAEAAATGRRHTLQESRELEKRMDFLSRQIESVSRDLHLVAEQPSSDAREEFLLLAPARRRALLQEVMCLDSQKMDPDLSGMSESDRAAEAERLRQKMLQKARCLLEQGDIHGSRELRGKARIIDFDPKQRGMYYNSVCCVHLCNFDHGEESPAGPMRFTDRPVEDKIVEHDRASINILSVKIACSDIGFPIQVYGAVVARDCVDYKRVYLFNRDSDHCQLINSEKEALILTGPKRGLALSYVDDYVETDLWVKDCNGHCRQFSRGIVRIPGTATQILDKGEAEIVSLATRLSTVDVTYDVVKLAVEATVAVEVLQGEFYGKMAAHTTSSMRMIVLYDDSTGGNGHGVIQLTRPAVSVYVKDMLIILVKTAAGDYKGIKFTPRWNGGDEYVLTLSDVTMRVKVAWSIINPC